MRFLRDREAPGFRANTATKHASTINALMNIAVKEKLIERNPFDLSIDASEDEEDRTPWTKAPATEMSQGDARAIACALGSPAYTGGGISRFEITSSRAVREDLTL